MPRYPSGRRLLTRLFDEAASPIYLLNGERQVVYCNRACRQWIGSGLDEQAVVGQVCHFHSSPSLAMEPVTGLCPPPSAFSTSHSSGTVWARSSTGEKEAIVRRPADFFGFQHDDADWVLAIVGLRDLKYGVAAPEMADEAELHDALLTIRARRRTILDQVNDQLLGNEPAVQVVRQQVTMATEVFSSLVIVGRPGSQRALLAEQIADQRQSTRGGRWFPIQCRLVDSESLKAALEVATTTRSTEVPSTLILLDVDQLVSDAQSVLLSYVTRESETVAALSTATRQPLALVEFDAELAMRLSPLVIELPPLSSRREDLPLLIQAAVERYNAEGRHRQVEQVSDEAMQLLVAHPWHGELEELQALVHKACLACQSEVIWPDDLPSEIHLTADALRYPPAEPPESIQLDDYLNGIERQLIERAIHQSGGNRARAARLLGISRARLLRRLESFRMSEPAEESRGS